jgi:hypothetical protein
MGLAGKLRDQAAGDAWAIMASPTATTRIAVKMSSSAMSLTGNPLAPARSAP